MTRSTAPQTAEDLRALWALGYFTDVQLLVQRCPQGIVYVVRVQERPSVRAVKLAGQRGAQQGRPQGHHRHQGRHHPGHGRGARERQEDPGEVRREGLLPRRGHPPARPGGGRQPGRRGLHHQRARQGDGEGDHLPRRGEGPAGRAQGGDGSPRRAASSPSSPARAPTARRSSSATSPSSRPPTTTAASSTCAWTSPPSRSPPTSATSTSPSASTEGEPYDIGKLDFSGDLIVPKEELAG